MDDLKSIASRGTCSRRNNKQKVCRVCLKKARGLVNIFDSIPESGISIADMISQCTEVHVFKGDSFPETICPPCLQDAKNSFEIKQTYEGIQQFKVKKEGFEHLLEESEPQMEYFQIDEYLPDEVKDEPFEEYLPGQVMNEPIEEDHPLEEDVCESLDYDIDPSYLQGNSADTDSQEQCPNLSTRNEEVMTNAEEIQFQCTFCPRFFQTLVQLKIHKYTHAEPTYKCDFCEKAFVRQSALEQHERTHTGERPFKCSICQQDFQTQTQFSIHFKSHPLNSVFKCARCGLAYTSQGDLDKHFKTHKITQLYNCPQCIRVFHSQKFLKNHIQSTHFDKARSHTEVPEVPERTFKCFHCDKPFTRNQALVLHMKYIHHVKTFECSYCEETFRRNQDLALHLKRHHL